MRLEEEESPSLQQVAARIIQRAWRRYVCREVFRYVQSLINQYRQQDPKTALRTVNPREAELLDGTAGVFIRFRLGGVTFPPNIYYKIFTFRPVVDLCASSPRDYTKQGRRTNSGWGNNQDRAGWYQRKENNSWRLYCSKSVCTNKPIEIGADKNINFHYSRLQRRQDVAKWRKRRKIGWLKKMYDRGRLAEEGNVETVLKDSAQEVMNNFEVKDEDEILDWELDELLAWTDTLNFDEYIQEWKYLACSFSSEIFTEVHSC